MKNLILTFLLIVSISVANAQIFNFGIKGGINYNSNGDLRGSGFSEIVENAKISSDEETGFHVGILTEMKLPLWLYLRPELYYEHTESSYQGSLDKTKLKLDKINAPILIGIRFLGIGRVFLGPSFHYTISTSLKDTPSFDNIKKISSDDFSVGGQIGLGLNLGKFGADIRWETGFTDTEAVFVGDILGDLGGESIKIDTSPQQFILSFYYKFM